MFSKLKVFFLVATCSLSLGLGFLLPALPNQKTAFAKSDSSSVLASLPVFDADKYAKSWSSKERKKIIDSNAGHLFIIFLFSKSPEIIATDSDGTEWAYKFDEVVSAFKGWANKQKAIISGLNPNWSSFPLSPLAQNQILQFYGRNGKYKIGDLTTKRVAQYWKIMAEVWNAIQPLVHQMNTLDIKQYKTFWGKTAIFNNPVDKEWDYSKSYTYEQFKVIPWGSFDFSLLVNILFDVSSIFFAKKTLTAALDKEWFSKLQLLQSAPGLASLRADKEDVDVSSLTSSNAQHIAGLGKDQTDTLAKFKETTYLDLQKLVAPHIKLLTDYKKTIQTSLNLFAKYGITKSNLNGKNYNLSELLKAENLNKPVAGLSVPAVQQLGNLYKVTPHIISQHFTTAFIPIKTYKDDIQVVLNEFAENHITTFTLDDVNYQLNHLLDTNNLGKSAADLSAPAAKQLKTLYDAKVKSEDFTTALSQILTARETQVQKEKAAKKANDKKTVLTIGLAAGGGVLLLAGGAGGFLYWFYKIKK